MGASFQTIHSSHRRTHYGQKPDRAPCRLPVDAFRRSFAAGRTRYRREGRAGSEADRGAHRRAGALGRNRSAPGRPAGTAVGLKAKMFRDAPAGDAAGGTKVLRLVSNDDRLKGTARVWLSDDLLPQKMTFQDDGGRTDVEIEFDHPRFESAWPAEKWV